MVSGSPLLGPQDLRDIAAKLDVTPTKKLGQNFVHDINTVRKIVRLAGVQPGDRVIEIGPGLGSLTLGITEAGGIVEAVEIDGRLAEELPQTLAKKQPLAELRVIHKDALELQTTDFSEPPKVLVANLPYNVSVPILMHLLELLPSLERGLVMVQAEVGERIAARPGSKAYGAPSAKAAWYGQWDLAAKVSRKIFWPVPGVDSVLVSYQKREQQLADEELRQKTFELVQHAFAGRRKMLRQSLQGGLGSGASDIITAAGIDPTLRAENLSIAQFLAIASF